ncbi:MAG: conserved membrane protein of unknown function [Promethearchaeota archaeon]|nr:MAG: conserved membrane protein of unknown function [Candidatus Lokiarchaeota archaeon]
MEPPQKKLLFQIGNIVAVVVTIIINLLANALPLNNISTGELADLYPNLLVPAGYVFSIWFIIYVLITILAIYQAKDLFKSEKEELPFIEKIGPYFIIASLGNISWIFFWHYQIFLLPLVAIVVLFLGLLMCYLRLDIAISDAPKNEKIFVHLPISVYFGWSTVATVAQVTAILVQVGLPSFGTLAELLTILVIAVLVLIGLLVIFTRRDFAYGAVLVWASIGIFVKQLPLNILISITGLIAAIAVSAGLIYTAYLLSKKE